MKLFAALLTCAICTTTVFCSSQSIVCGNVQGEIYFTGVHPSLCGFPAFYYSDNYGETIVLRSSTGDPEYDMFGGLLSDAADSIVYRLRGELQPLGGEYLTTDGGYNWTQEDTILTSTYASGVISGEIYRQMDNDIRRLERSSDYSFQYFPCSCLGGPDSLGIYSAALGIDSGEVYILGDHGKLYYSEDYAESFICLGDLYHNFNVDPQSYILNGQEPGEVFIFHHDSQRIWRVYHYGSEVQLLANFNYNSYVWRFGAAVSRQPGELYFLAEDPDMVPGGTMHIYHTTDYFQTWIIYEHIVEWEAVDDPQVSIIPSSINLIIWPNPTNAAFNISYELNIIQDVRLIMYDILGRQIWRNIIGTQSPGMHHLSVTNDQLASGRYFLILQSQHRQIAKTITIIK